MNTGIIIQARMTSSRLPGKVMKKLADREILWHIVERCRKSKLADKVIVATSTDRSDDTIYEYCKENNIDVFRGNLNNVLLRFFECAKKYKLDSIVRITGDCPLITPEIIDGAIVLFKKGKVDYVGNGLYRVFPRGFDVEVFSFSALRAAAGKANDKYEREHVTPYIRQNFLSEAYVVPVKYRADFRLTVDDYADYKLMTRIYNTFYKPGTIINSARVIEYLKTHSQIASINNQARQKEMDLIIVTGGSLTKDAQNGWHSSKLTDMDRNNTDIIPDSYFRVRASSYLARKNANYFIIASGGKGRFKNLPDTVTVASVLQRELEKLGIPPNRIIPENNSNNTYQQLLESGKIAVSKQARQVFIVSNKWHLERIKAMIKYAPGLKIWSRIKKVKLVSAEDTVIQYDPSVAPLISKYYKGDFFKKRLELEKRGLNQIKKGIYRYATKI